MPDGHRWGWTLWGWTLCGWTLKISVCGRKACQANRNEYIQGIPGSADVTRSECRKQPVGRLKPAKPASDTRRSQRVLSSEHRGDEKVDQGRSGLPGCLRRQDLPPRQLARQENVRRTPPSTYPPSAATSWGGGPGQNGQAGARRYPSRSIPRRAAISLFQ